MANRDSSSIQRITPRLLVLLVLGSALALGGCNERDSGDGTVVTQTQLPVDTLLNLACADAGIWPNECVLNDPENPFRSVPILEFNEMDPGAENKFQLFNDLPPGPAGAKSRFYLWATALARRGSGENQWYTARALHELWNVSGDPIVQEQALRAYRSVLQNFFGSVTFFECCEGVSPDGTPVPFSVPLNEQVADNLFRTDSTGWARLVPGDPLLTISLLAEWGFTYTPATPPLYNDGVISVNDG